jgi:hypothetical protein
LVRKSAGAEVQRLAGQLFVPHAGNNDHGRAGELGQQALDGLQPLAVRQVEVQQHHVHFIAFVRQI